MSEVPGWTSGPVVDRAAPAPATGADGGTTTPGALRREWATRVGPLPAPTSAEAEATMRFFRANFVELGHSLTARLPKGPDTDAALDALEAAWTAAITAISEHQEHYR